MKRFLRPALALLLLALLARCASYALPKTMTEEKLREVRARLAQGDTFQSFSPVEGTDLKHAQIYAIIDAPPERVWKLITDYNHYHEFMPLVEKSKIRWVKGRIVKLEYRFGIMGVPLKYKVVVAMVHYPKARRVEWVYIEGDIRDTYGSWTLKPFGDDRTELAYSLFMDLGGTAVGSLGTLVQLGSGVALAQVIDAIRERVQSERYDKIPVPDYALPSLRRPGPIDREFADFD